jgi:hypothetical protein
MADAIGEYRAALDEMRRFALEQFRRDLDDLVERVGDFSAHR